MPRQKMAAELRRAQVFGRVDPKTIQFLNSRPEPNYGRVLDALVNEYLELIASKRRSTRTFAPPPEPADSVN